MTNATTVPTSTQRGFQWRYLALAVVLLVLGGFAYLASMRPSNDRAWESGMETLAGITIQGDVVSVQNIRDQPITSAGAGPIRFIPGTFNADRITRVWLVKEPFVIGGLKDFKGSAHTYFVFDFADQPPVAVSVEARREKGETYDIARGALNQFELIYIWGTERDFTIRRPVVEKNPLHMYPLLISSGGARELFLQMARATQDLQTQPRFYNSLASNCTNELAYAANRVKAGAIPPNIAFILPGYTADVLYGLGFIPNNRPMEEIERLSDVSEVVLQNYERDNFPTLLRDELQRRYQL